MLALLTDLVGKANWIVLLAVVLVVVVDYVVVVVVAAVVVVVAAALLPIFPVQFHHILVTNHHPTSRLFPFPPYSLHLPSFWVED